MSDEKWMTEQQAKQEWMSQTNSAHQGLAQTSQVQGVGWSSVQGQQVRDKALMEQSVAQAHAALESLDRQVSELLERIAPVCQPKGSPPPSGLANGATNQIEATPSPLRAEFLKLRAHADAIATRISAIRYTIEI